MPLFVRKVYSKEDAVTLYGFDLKPDSYMGKRYVITFGLDLRKYPHNEAIQKLIGFRGHVYSFDNYKEFIKVFDSNLSGHTYHKR